MPNVVPFVRKKKYMPKANQQMQQQAKIRKGRKVRPDDKVVGYRSIGLEWDIWEALDEDAKLCGRSSSAQLRQILMYYYGLSPAEVDTDRVKETRDNFSERVRPAS